MQYDRRRFLTLGLGAAAAAVVTACTGGKGGASGPTTTTQPTTTTLGPSPSDIALLKTSASLEALAVSVYQRAARSDLATSATVVDAMTTFQSHHTVQLQTLNGLLETATQPDVTAANEALDREIFQPAIAAATAQDDVVRMLLTLEDALTQFYSYAAPVALKPEHRAALVTIGGVQARHRAVLGFVFANESVDDLYPSPFAPSDNPLPPDAILS
jgi:hypothetical protein